MSGVYNVNGVFFFFQSNFKDVMESLAVARTEYEQKTHAIAVVRPALLLHSYRDLSIVHVQGDGVLWTAGRCTWRHCPFKMPVTPISTL